MLTRHDVGHRVTIRQRVTPSDDHQRYSELVGELLAVTETECLVRTSMDTIRVSRADMTAARRMPAKRALSATGQLERVASAGWPAPDLSHLGDWELRAGAGWSNRANSALAIGQPDRHLPEAIDAVIDWYRERGLTPAISVPEPLGSRVTAELQRRKWRSSPPSLVMIANLGQIVDDADRLWTAGTSAPAAEYATSPTLAEAGAEAFGELAVRCDPNPPEAWFEYAAKMPRGLPDVGRKILTSVPISRFAGVYHQNGQALGIARGVIAADLKWLGLGSVQVSPGIRRRGLATEMIGVLARWALGEGASRAYLQVLESNAPGIAVYRRVGFTAHHRYRTWSLAPDPHA